MGIHPQQFEEMKKRLQKSRPLPSPVFLDEPIPWKAAQTVLGIDPSLRGTGYGIVRNTKNQWAAVDFGTIACPQAWPHSRCLAHIGQTLRQILAKHHPDICVFEALFYAQNFQTALTMGEARGASLAVVAEAGIDIYEIATRKVKQAIVGYGAAQKTAVAKMVQRMLSLAEPPTADAADALAAALAHAQQRNRYQLGSARKL